MIVLDTHAWLWWASARDQLSATAATAIAEAEAIGVSAISCWEVTMLAELGRIALDRPVERWLRAALRADDRLRALELTAPVAAQAALLGHQGFHADPADRFIYATARSHDAALVTKDRLLRDFDAARTLW